MSLPVSLSEWGRVEGVCSLQEVACETIFYMSPVPGVVLLLLSVVLGEKNIFLEWEKGFKTFFFCCTQGSSRLMSLWTVPGETSGS